MQINQNLYDFLKLIPKDKVISYKFLSKIFLKHPRNIAQILSQNKEQNTYPCYKVVNVDGTLWGYNLWIDQKRQKLFKDNIIINDDKIEETFFWKPKLYNFFVAFPLEWESFLKFTDLSERLFHLSDFINFQNINTPHITLRFFWQLDLLKFKEIVLSTLSNISKLPKTLKNKAIKLSEFNNFFDKVYFLTSNSQILLKEFEDFYDKFNYIHNLNTEDRGFKPHLTLFRTKEGFDKSLLNKIEILLSWYDFFININKLRFYCTIENHNQIPLIDMSLNEIM